MYILAKAALADTELLARLPIRANAQKRHDGADNRLRIGIWERYADKYSE